MSKIIDVSLTHVSIGTNDGKIEEVKISDLNFIPHINDEVEIFKSENKIIVNKIEKETVYLYTNKKIVNKYIYILLAIFTGTFGVHKFYAGKTSSGIAYVIFFWTGIPTIVSIVEAIISIFKLSDINGNIEV